MTHYISTRGDGTPHSNTESKDPLKFEDVLLGGLAPDGGLYVPCEWPSLDMDALQSGDQSYSAVAAKVMQAFVGDCISEDDFSKLVDEAYAQGVFNHHSVTPLVQLGPNLWSMEHFHGPTLAFKDVALQLLGRLFDHVLEKKNQRITIVGATSGDTGSAAIEACKACKYVDIFILHPNGRVSDVQRKQMTTVQSENVYNIAIDGNFDDCQNLVKAMFGDHTFRDEIGLSAINSINWARIMAQIVYYITACQALGGMKQKVSFCVPTGNFGNVFAAYAAKKMGAPIHKLIISTNRNDILTRFFETGEMAMESVEPSHSPSMDIQISSNFERYLFDLMGRDHEKLAETMTRFKEVGSFKLDDHVMKQAQSEFSAYRCDDAQTLTTIQACYDETGIVIDPHTAVGLSAAKQALEKDPSTPIVNLACAHPAKFPDAVKKAIGKRPPLPDHMHDLMDRQEIYTNLPNDLEKVQDYIRNHTRVKNQKAA